MLAINNQNHRYNVYKKNPYKKYLIIINVFIFLNLLNIFNAKWEINLIIEGGGEINFLSDIFYKNPDKIIVQGNKINPNGKTYNFPSGLNELTIIFENQIESCENMFKELTNLKEIDFSNFDNSKSTNMAHMFDQCTNLEKINFGNINTSSVKNMEFLFWNCRNLISIDVLNFETSSVTSMYAMFCGCASLTSLNLSNFNTSNVENMHDMFGFNDKLTSVYILNFDTSKVKNMQGMFNRNYQLQYLDLSNFNTNLVTNMQYMFEQNGLLKYLNLYSFIINSGTQIKDILLNTPPNLKICINDLNTRNKLASYGKTFDCSDVCIKKNLKIDSEYRRCVENCNESNYKYEYNNTCYDKCPKETFNIINEYFCFDEKPEGYYLDLNDLKYKKCFDRCKNCYGLGNETNNNCIECKSNISLLNGSLYDFLYELNLDGYKNCFIKCPHYFYFDKDSSIYFCTENKKCDGIYDKYLFEKNECFNKCEDDEKYKYEFKKRCYEQCPEGSIKVKNNSVINDYFCKPICSEEKPFEYIYTQECVKNCPIKDMKQNTCIQNYKANKTKENNQEENKEEDTKAQDILLQNIETGFTSEDYNTSNLEKGEDDIFEDEKMTVTLTTTQNQKNNTNNNMTIIDLGECEDLLRKEYNISDNEILYMKKIDVIQEGMKIPKVEYDVYSKLNGKNLIKLNLTVCENSKISLSIPIKITESLDKLNSSSGYYNDICYVATSDSGTDISLNDRKKEFVDGNQTVCQDECEFSEYDYNNQKVKCSCKVKESSSSLAEMKINKTKLYENFINIKNLANIKLLVCFNELFSDKGIQNNIAFYIIIPIIIFHVIVIILFYTKYKKTIKDTIEDISFGIKYLGLVKIDEKRKEMEKRKKLLNKKRNKKKSNRIFQRNKNNLNKKNDEKKVKKIEEIKLLNPIDYYFLTEILNKKDNPPKKRSRERKSKINDEFNKGRVDLMNTNNEKNSKRSILIKNMNEQEIIKKAKIIMEYNDEEKNNLKYKLALKYDKRTYIEYYLSLLKTKHLFIFSFFNNNDYNSRIIKIDLFFISFTLYYAVNALFFNDNTMHKIYEDEGSFNFIYQLPQIIYSSLISNVLDILLKLLALSEGNILDYKKNKDKKDLGKRKNELNNKLKIKFILYFIISFLLLLIFWYYLSMFCAIYRNTQYHLIKDTLISFGLSLIYPFAIYLLPGIFRIPALSDRNNKRNWIYNISLLSQFL